MSDPQPNRPRLRFRPRNVLGGAVIIGLGLLAAWRIFFGPVNNADSLGYLPGFNPRVFYGVVLVCMITVGVLMACMPTVPGRSKPMADQLEDRRQYAAIFGATRLPNWLAGSLLALIFAAFAALLWAGRWE